MHALLACSGTVRIWGSNSLKQPDRNAFLDMIESKLFFLTPEVMIAILMFGEK